MSIILRLDRVMADRKMSLNELSEKVGVSNVNLSKLKTGKVSAVRFSTLNAICKALKCQPGDILEFVDDGNDDLAQEPLSERRRNPRFGASALLCTLRLLCFRSTELLVNSIHVIFVGAAFGGPSACQKSHILS